MSKKLLPVGNCPYCDAEQGVNGGWGGSPEMFDKYKLDHDAGHPNHDVPNKNLEAFYGSTPSKPEWKDSPTADKVRFVLAKYMEKWDVDLVIELTELLSSHRRSLAEEVGKLRVENAHGIPPDFYNKAIEDVLTIINREI